MHVREVVRKLLRVMVVGRSEYSGCMAELPETHTQVWTRARFQRLCSRTRGPKQHHRPRQLCRRKHNTEVDQPVTAACCIQRVGLLLVAQSSPFNLQTEQQLLTSSGSALIANHCPVFCDCCSRQYTRTCLASLLQQGLAHQCASEGHVLQYT